MNFSLGGSKIWWPVFFVNIDLLRGIVCRLGNILGRAGDILAMPARTF